MTVVLDRPCDGGARTHALVIGCGRFPHLDAALQADRQSCYDSALEVVTFLAAKADAFELPLARIDLLLADPRAASGTNADLLPEAVRDRVDETAPAVAAFLVIGPVEAPTAQNVQLAFDRLVAAAQPGDAVVIYGCSHGVAGRDETGLLVLEDVGSSVANRWAQVLNVKFVASSLPARLQASSVWIFMDACQEVLVDLVDQVDGVTGLKPISVSFREVARSRVRSVAIAAAHYGGVTQAPVAGGTAYFTEALLDALGHSCVEVVDGRWKVTAKELPFAIERIAAARGLQTVEASVMTIDTRASALLSVEAPNVPVHVASIPARMLEHATSAYLHDGAVQVFPKAAGAEWRFRAPLTPSSYQLHIHRTGSPDFVEQIDIRPPAVLWSVREP